MKVTRGCIWNIISKIVTLWGFLSIIWIIASYFNVVPWYEIKFKKSNSLDLITNLFSGQDIQLDFNTLKYIERTDISDVHWTVSDDHKPVASLDGLRPILSLPKDAEGILNLSVKINLADSGSLEGYSNIYVVQQKSHEIQTEQKQYLPLEKKTLPTNAMGFVSDHSSSDLLEIELYAGHNYWLKRKVLKSDGQYYFIFNPGDKFITTNNKIIFRIPSLTAPTQYYSLPYKGN